jgi:hypothetical protein
MSDETDLERWNRVSDLALKALQIGALVAGAVLVLLRATS